MYTSAIMLQARRGSRLVSLALCFVGSLACGSQTSVDAYVDEAAKDVCDKVIACSCEYPNGANLEHCLGQLTVTLDSTSQLNLVEGLSFDGDCADKAIAEFDKIGCGVTPFEPDAKCEAPCKLWYGPVGKGGTCSGGHDNCKQGLVCGNDSICVDPCAKPKLPKVGEVCGSLLGCIEGAFCDLENGLNPVCVPLPIAGQPCATDSSLCAAGLYCDTTDPDAKICATLPALGEECTFQCGANLYCDNAQSPAVCAAVPSLGQDCPLGGCLAPYVCNSKQVCEEPPPQVCGFYGGLPLEDCTASQFTCGDGGCIDSAEECDMTPQCADGSDEAPINPNCMAGCAVDEFTCDDSSCVSALVQCDGSSDCPDGSDEAPVNPLCP
jgi:hypothetical protein